MEHSRTFRHGLAIRDVVASIVMLSVLGAILMVAQPRQRALGQLGESMSNLRELGVGFEAYGRDNADQVATFSWKKGNNSSSFPDLRNPVSDIDAAAYQAVDIIRRRANLSMTQFPRQTSWVPNIFYSHLVLIDYFASPAPWNTAVSPGDANQLKWASDPLKWQTNGAPAIRWPFASSYELPTAFSTSPDSGPDAVYQSTTHSAYIVPGNAKFGGRTLTEVVYPASKALMYERYQWFFGPRVAFCLYDEARVPVLSGDGQVQVRKPGLVNKGWQPNAPTSPQGTIVSYTPAAYEPPALLGVSNLMYGRMRWTRRAMGGTDFDAGEIP